MPVCEERTYFAISHLTIKAKSQYEITVDTLHAANVGVFTSNNASMFARNREWDLLALLI